jgi:hypothetical protein
MIDHSYAVNDEINPLFFLSSLQSLKIIGLLILTSVCEQCATKY